MAVEEFTIVFKHGTLDAEFALQSIRAEIAERHIPSSGFELYEAPADLAEVWPRLKKTGGKTFNLVGRGFVFHLGSVRNFQLDFLGIKSAGEQQLTWDKWASRFIGNSNFVMGWVADAEYQFWQNAEDPLEYRSTGRSHEHLPKKSNGLPPPLEQTVVDISANPGRRLLRIGYYEVVGAVMWLGKDFWQLAGADKTKIDNTQWLQVSNPLPGVTRVEAAAKGFTTDEGTSGELQRRLRSLLFPDSQIFPKAV